MVSGSGIGFTAVILLALGAPAFAQTAQSNGGGGRYEQHNLGPTGCDIVIAPPRPSAASRPVHFDEGQRQNVGGALMICRGGKLFPADQPPPRPSN